MAQFQLKLLTSRITTANNTVKFLETTISEFYDQLEVEYSKQNSWKNRNFNYCYTFDEQLSLHTNGQKELTFSMVKNIWLDNELTENPFISKIKNGTQLLLIDQYENEYMFTVKDIKYSLNSSNITYNYTCQDSFTYQHIRQNSGYTIENEIGTTDFIGAKTIDWWVLNKIKKECHISYQYLPLTQGLYLSKNTKNLIPYNKLNETQKDVEKIVKPIYDIEHYPELHEKIPFAVSDSNASAALIALAEELGLMLNYREHNIHNAQGERTNSFVRYFWLEPKKNEKTANFKYSPKVNIQSFDFSHDGNALTTILNVMPTQYGDEYITLIPDIPPFFNTLFASTSWEKSLFTDGYFSSICQEKIFFCEDGQAEDGLFKYDLELNDNSEDAIENGDSFWTTEYIYLKVYNKSDKTFKIPEHYPKISLNHKEKDTSLFINNQYYSSKTNQMDFVIYQDNEFISYNNTYNFIPNSLLDTTQEKCYVRIKTLSPLIVRPIIKNSKIVLNFTREATGEELEFAKIADQCPWLENKLIDFSYFLKQNILSQAEYKELLNTFTNELRIINGRLLYYSKEYYRSIQDKTKKLALLTSTLDSLGAAFNSDAVETFKTTGNISNIDYFKEAYQTLQVTLNKENEKTPIANYNAIIGEYFDNYFKAKQRFLKNIYYFKQYFNQKIQWEEGIRTAKKTLHFNSSPNYIYEDDKCAIKRYISFSKKPTFSLVTSSFDNYDHETYKNLVPIFSNDRVTELTVVHKDNCKDFLVNTIEDGEMVRCGSTDGYNGDQLYYRVAYSAKIGESIDNWPDTIVDTNNLIWYLYGHDDENVWYCSSKPDSEFTEWPLTIQDKNSQTELKQIFIPITFKKIVNEYIYKQLKENKDIGWYIQDSNTNKSTSEWFSDSDLDTELSHFLPSVFGNTFSAKDWDGDSFKNLVHAIKTFFTGVDSNETTDDRVNFYKAHFPITTVTYTGPSYTQSKYTWDGKTYDYQQTNKTGKTFSDYLDYLKKSEVEKDLNVEVISSPFNKKEYTQYSIPVVTPDMEQKYFRRVPKGGAIGAAAAVALSGLWVTFPLNPTLNWLNLWAVSQSIWYADTKWSQSGVNTRSFNGEHFIEYVNEEPIKRNFSGYHDWPEIFYAKTATSYDEWKAIDTQRTNNIEEISDIKLSKSSSLSGWKKSTIEYGSADNTYYLYYKTHKDFNDYFNLYSKIGFTYSSAITTANTLKGSRGKTLTFKDGYLRPVVKNELINKNAKYRILMLTDNEGKDIVFAPGFSYNDLIKEDTTRISKIKYYFIDNNTSSVDLSDLTDKTQTWDEYVTPYNCSYNNKIFTHITDDNKTYKFMIFQDEDFTQKQLYSKSDWNESDNTLKKEKRFSLYDSSTIYGVDKMEIQFHKKSDLVEGFFKPSNGESGFESVADMKTPIVWISNNEDDVETTKFFKKINGEEKRFYTIEQIKKQGIFLYINNDTYEENTLSNAYEFRTNVFLHQEYYNISFDEDGNKVYTINSEVGNTFTKESFYIFDFSQTQIDENGKYKINVVIEDEMGNNYSNTCELTEVFGTEEIGNLTNGHFWYLYHKEINQSTLFETAAAIETELTQYWQQAYNASLYCEYFLPSSWQSRSDGDTNYFNKNVIILQEKRNSNDNTVNITPVLSNMYLPEVSIYNNGITSRLPMYQLKYLDSYSTGYSCDPIQQIVDPNHDTPAIEVLLDHPSYREVFETLGEDIQNYSITNYDPMNEDNLPKTTYYYVANPNSGTKWKDFLQKHSTIPYVFEDYSGLYVMAYKILKKQYKSKPDWNYNFYQKRQNFVWDRLYKQYPGILLEDAYSNENATTSTELFTTSKMAFKDKQEPERNYSISLINAYNNLLFNTQNKFWTKYSGQELKIGEGILVDVEEYYTSIDDISKTLSQYLFITDISYALRKNSDIQVTVNSIKYQDKLIQRLVKLIK